MTVVRRDERLEIITLMHVERRAHTPGFAARVQARLDDVEQAGGPDAPALRAAEAVAGMHEEFVDAPAWAIVALLLLRRELARGLVDPHGAYRAIGLLEEAMVHAAAAEALVRHAFDELDD